MKPQPHHLDSPVRYHSLEQPKVPVWGVIALLAAIIAASLTLLHLW